MPISALSESHPTSLRPTLPRLGVLPFLGILLLTCGLGAFYIVWVQHKAIKALNPQALGPGVVLALHIVSAFFTLGILGTLVDYMQIQRLLEYADRANHPGRNPNLMMVVIGASVGGVLSTFLGWTGLLLIAAAAFQIFAMYTLHKELELYTDT